MPSGSPYAVINSFARRAQANVLRRFDLGNDTSLVIGI